jgi:hypothetical protein
MTALRLRGQRELWMGAPRGPAPPDTAPLRLSAASGLVCRGGQHYVVADDEHHLAVFGADGAVHWLRLFDGALPDPAALRKATKPDLETLLELPPMPILPHGALLALGSGSRPNRQRAVCLPFIDAHDTFGAPRGIDLAPLYAMLRGECADLNIEGGFVNGDVFCLLQRAHLANPANLCIRFGWSQVREWLFGGAAAPRPLAYDRFELGQIDGVPLGFTDATPLPGGAWAFSAAAEATDDSYHDGECAGSVLGIVGADGRIATTLRLPGRHKVEGLAATASQDPRQTLEFTLVTDADDRERAALMLRVQLDLAPG